MSVEWLKNLTVKIDKVRALFVLNGQVTLGRKRLASLLNVGEGYIRNLINGLKNDGLVKEDRHGNFLTSKGKNAITSISEYLVPYFNFEITGFLNSKAVLVKGASKYVKIGLEERDSAIKMGAAGALIITYSGGSFWFPGLANLTQDNPELVRSIKKHITPEENDVIIIAWGSKAKDAERGALNAALEIIKKAGKPDLLI